MALVSLWLTPSSAQAQTWCNINGGMLYASNGGATWGCPQNTHCGEVANTCMRNCAAGETQCGTKLDLGMIGGQCMPRGAECCDYIAGRWCPAGSFCGPPTPSGQRPAIRIGWDGKCYTPAPASSTNSPASSDESRRQEVARQMAAQNARVEAQQAEAERKTVEQQRAAAQRAEGERQQAAEASRRTEVERSQRLDREDRERTRQRQERERAALERRAELDAQRRRRIEGVTRYGEQATASTQQLGSSLADLERQRLASDRGVRLEAGQVEVRRFSGVLTGGAAGLGAGEHGDDARYVAGAQITLNFLFWPQVTQTSAPNIALELFLEGNVFTLVGANSPLHLRLTEGGRFWIGGSDVQFGVGWVLAQGVKPPSSNVGILTGPGLYLGLHQISRYASVLGVEFTPFSTANSAGGTPPNIRGFYRAQVGLFTFAVQASYAPFQLGFAEFVFECHLGMNFTLLVPVERDQ